MAGPTGAHTILNYYWEDAGFLQTPNDTTPKVFGANAQLTTREADNDATRIFLPASRRAVAIKAGSFQGSWAAAFGLTNPWWLRAILGAPSTVDNGDGTYTHTYDGDPEPLRLVEGYENTGAEIELQGSVPVRASVDPTVDENTAAVVLEGLYAKESGSSPASLTSQEQLSFGAFDYADASLSAGTNANAIVQNASLELAANVEFIPGFGSRFPIDFLAGAFEPTVDYTEVRVDEDERESVYGGSATDMQESVPTEAFQLDLDNGAAAGSGKNRVLFDCPASFPATYSVENLGDPQSRIDEGINRFIDDVVAEATNETATAP